MMEVQEDPPHVGVEHAAFGEEGRVLRLQRVRHVVALEEKIAVVEQRRHVGSALGIGNSEALVALQDVRPLRSARELFFEDDARGCGDQGAHRGFRSCRKKLFNFVARRRKSHARQALGRRGALAVDESFGR